MIDDEVQTARAAVAALQAGDERAKPAADKLDYAEAMLAAARRIAAESTSGGGHTYADELVTQARAALDLAVILTTDPPKVGAKRRGKK
jgi:hypothetical protein